MSDTPVTKPENGTAAFNRLQVILDSMEQAVLVTSADRRVVTWNHVYCNVWGCHGVIRRGMLVQELFEHYAARGLYGPGEPKKLARDRGAHLDRAPRTSNEEFAIPDGSLYWIHRERMPDGGRVTTYTNITERKIIEEALRESEQRFKAVVDNLPAAIILKDTKGHYLIANKRWHEWFNSDGLDITGKTAHDFFPRDYADRVNAQIREIGETGRSIEEEIETPFGDGTVRYTLVHKFSISDAHGQAVGIGTIESDITDRKRAEEELQKSRELFQALADNLPEFISLKDPEGRFLFVNKRFEEWVGLERNDVIGKTVHDIYPQEQATGFDALDRQAMDGRELLSREGDLSYPDGEARTVIRTRFPVISSQGEVLGLGTVNHDITDRKRAEQELQRAMKAAEAANEAKSAFLANMSHEVRTPLNAIIGMTRLALQTDLTRKQRDYLTKASAASELLLEVINDILDFSKIEAGKLNFESVDFELDEVLDNLATMVGQKAGDKGLELVFSTAPEVPTALVGDPLRLEQVLVNLTNNAVKFTERGEIVMTTEVHSLWEGGVKLLFSVQDTGIGLTGAQQTRLFEAFTQADESTTRKYGGSGLGLAISKQLVEMMSGEIWVDSVHGQGTTVSFTGQFGVREQKQEREIPKTIRGTRILVVDDSTTSREILSRMLEALAFDVTSVTSGEEALVELHHSAESPTKASYTAVLMDWKMPGMDGLEATLRIKQDGTLPEVPAVIMVTAFDKDELFAQAGCATIDGLLTKPISRSTLFDKMMEVFGNDRQPEDRRPSEVAATPSATHHPLRGVRILLVEDNVLNQQIGAEILKPAGATVDVVSNGREAVERVCDSDGSMSYHAVLMDIQMPEMDGYDATRVIRADGGHPDLPIIAMTAHAMPEERQQCLRAGMNDHVSKPIDPERLVSTLIRWVAPSQQAKRTDVQKSSGTGQESDGLPTRVNGLEISEGVRRLSGNVALYCAALNEFEQNEADAGLRLRESLENNNRDAAARIVHDVKGLSGNLSATTLYRGASELESALRTTDPVEIDPLLEKFEEALLELLASIKSLELERTQSKARPVDRRKQSGLSGELAVRLQELARLLDQQNLNAEEYFEAITLDYDLSAGAEEVAELELQLEKLEFRRALSTLRALTQRLGFKDIIAG